MRSHASFSENNPVHRPGRPAVPVPAIGKITSCPSPAVVPMQPPISNGRPSPTRALRIDGSGRIALARFSQVFWRIGRNGREPLVSSNWCGANGRMIRKTLLGTIAALTLAGSSTSQATEIAIAGNLYIGHCKEHSFLATAMEANPQLARTPPNVLCTGEEIGIIKSPGKAGTIVVFLDYGFTTAQIATLRVLCREDMPCRARYHIVSIRQYEKPSPHLALAHSIRGHSSGLTTEQNKTPE